METATFQYEGEVRLRRATQSLEPGHFSVLSSLYADNPDFELKFPVNGQRLGFEFHPKCRIKVTIELEQISEEKTGATA